MFFYWINVKQKEVVKITYFILYTNRMKSSQQLQSKIYVFVFIKRKSYRS